MRVGPGTRLGSYEVLSPLGAGGMGEVWRARDCRLGREVAIKLLPPELASDREHLDRFEQEARSASALNHPNIVTIHEIGQEGSVRFLVMELVDGRTLKELTATGPLALRKALPIASQLADGLAKAHAAGIVHRDLKPQNLMVSNDGFVKILDFGLAKLAPSDRGELSTMATWSGPRTAAGVILGTVGYMSPEQARGAAVDFRSDQFSFGAILYEMVTGKRAFEKETAVETLAAILNEEPEPIGTLNPRVPAPLCWIVERCLAKDPADRYASTRDLARDLEAVRQRVDRLPAESRESRPVNLPAPRTRFVGRERELANARELLLREDVRLLTLTGLGGIGKTRLALQVAGETADWFTGGVFFVPLASVGSAELVPSAIAQAVGARQSGASPAEALVEHFQTSDRAPALLLLDSFEHILSAAPLVAELIAAGRHVKILVTSRSPLHVYGEHELPVPPLAVPDLRRPATLESLSAYDGVALFLQRAAAVKPGFAATEDNAGAIAEICARLDGLPLAIELAAARVKLLSPAAMRQRLGRRLDLLTGGARDLPERQQTLRGAIDWSHGLLNEAEQRLFRRLSVFCGGATLEAVEAVCDAKSDLRLDPLEGMESMVDKSLVQQVEGKEGELRFLMLEIVREYAREQLAASEDETLTRRAHAAYYLVLAEEEGAGEGERAPGAADPLDAEHDNFRAALEFLAEHGEAEWGLRLAAALFGFWQSREHFAEGRAWLTRLLVLPAAAARTKLRARALFAAGALASEQGDLAVGQPFAEESLEISREQGDSRGVAVSLNALAVYAFDRGNLAAARRLTEENLALWREMGDREATARALSNLANVAKAQGDSESARSLHEEALSIFREIGDRSGVAWALDQQGDVACEQGDIAAARALYEKSLAAFRDANDRRGIAGALADLGNLAVQQGDHDRARTYFRESLDIYRELDHKRGIARVLECYACSLAARGESERALRLAGSAAALRQAVGAPLGRADRERLDTLLAPAREALADSTAGNVWMEGWATPLEEAIASALASGSASPLRG